MTKKQKNFLVISLAAILSSCARQQVTVPNIQFFGDKGRFGATMVESLHPEKPGVRLLKTPWDEKRIGMVCTAAANIRTLQTIVDKLCAENRTVCYYAKDGVTEVQRALSAGVKAAEAP